MFRTSLLYFAAAALALANDQVPGQEISGGSGTLKSGVTIRYRSVATPDESGLNLIVTGITVSESVVHRFVVDKATGTYFGYDLAIGPPDANNRYQAVFQPLTEVDRMTLHLSGNPSLKPMMLPKYPAPQMVGEGDLIALDLMVSPDGTRKLTDYIEVLLPPGATAIASDATAQDFTVDDGPVAFVGSPDGIWINGKDRVEAAFTGKPGATFWMAVSGLGRYIVSLTPHEGFTKSGTMHGDTISWEDGGLQYDVRFEKPIAGRGKSWNLYVLHDVSYTAKEALQGIVTCGTDRIDNLLKSR